MLHNYTYIFLYNVYYNENIALHVYVRIFPSMFITPLSPPRLFFQGKIRNFAMRPGFLAFDVCGSSCPFFGTRTCFFLPSISQITCSIYFFLRQSIRSRAFPTSFSSAKRINLFPLHLSHQVAQKFSMLSRLQKWRGLSKCYKTYSNVPTFFLVFLSTSCLLCVFGD